MILDLQNCTVAGREMHVTVQKFDPVQGQTHQAREDFSSDGELDFPQATPDTTEVESCGFGPFEKAPRFSNKFEGARTMSKVSKAIKLRKQRDMNARRADAAIQATQDKEKERIAEKRAFEKEQEKEAREEECKRRAEDRVEERKIHQERRQHEAQHPGQTVIYTSRFIDNLSDITDDMCISASFSVKAGKLGGSGRGSFVDSNKFLESDLNFYISVKVINQTLNFKDALLFNPISSKNENDFQQVYGDSFISGFLEGGEFNALISMKIFNKAKIPDIKAAFTAGLIDVDAEAKVETNAETTIQVSWCGGGHIKPIEQRWDIKSIMQAAARFPGLVAECPQRTYAILTKYDSLRSFVAAKPTSYTRLQYGNAQIYTNALMNFFMAYKLLEKRLDEQISNVKNETLELVPWASVDGTAGTTNTSSIETTQNVKVSMKKNKESGLYPYIDDQSRFADSLNGLIDAREAIYRQMVRIVKEVDLIEKYPELATDEDHPKPFQSPVIFETRLPRAKIPKKLGQNSTTAIAQAGIAGPSQWDPNKGDCFDLNLVKFYHPYTSAPRMISGLTKLDQSSRSPIRLEMRHQNQTSTGFEVITRTFLGAKSYGSLMSWMALPDNDIHIETGVYNSLGMYRFGNDRMVVNRIPFSRRFNQSPRVVTWIYEVDMSNGWHSITTGVSAAYEEHFDISIKFWSNNNNAIRIGWLSFSDTGCNNRMKVGHIRVTKEEKWKRGNVTFDGIPFTKIPAVFIALMEFDVDDDYNLRLHGQVTDRTVEGFSFECGSFSSSKHENNMNRCQWVWIAAE
ncbi:hypothetical protein ACMFMG_004305 [Clarireedia jacksonii]